MKTSRFETLFGKNRTIYMDSPEWRFVRAITDGRVEEAVALFGTRRCYGQGAVKVDTPYDTFEGPEAIEVMAKGWLAVFDAVSATAVPVAQTRAGGRSVTELVLHYTTRGGEERAVPMAAVAELKADNLMDELRLYYHWRAVPGSPAYRPPLFPAQGDGTTRQEMISGAVGDYFRLLHSPDGGIVEHAADIFSDPICFGGYEPQDWSEDFGPQDRQKFTEHLSRDIGHTLSTYVRLRMETIIDDGRTCCVEWEQLVTKAGREERGRISQAGISFYERDEAGRICSVRIIDYAYAESKIDWNTARRPRDVAEAMNFLDE